MTNWAVTEAALGACVLAAAMPREDVLLIPERRDWLAPLRKLSRRVRARIDDAAGQEADEYIEALHRDPETPVAVIRQSELPRAVATVPVRALGPGEASAPWAPAQWAPPADQAPPPPAKPRKRAGDPPTIVMEALLPEVRRSVKPYLDSLSYDD